MIVKSALLKEGFRGMQSGDKSLCSKRNGGGRVLKSFKEACDETKARLS